LPAEVTLKDGSTASKASEAERKLVGEAADRLDLDATEALVLLRSYAVLQRGMAAWQEDADLEPDPEWWISLETFYFDERVTAIKLLVTILEACSCFFRRVTKSDCWQPTTHSSLRSSRNTCQSC
jgi:hypothetical protein